MATADIKKFTGFIAPDGSTHDSQKKAIEHTRNLKIKEALQQFSANHVPELDLVGAVITPKTFADFLFNHRESISDAFSQEVRMRAERKKKPVASTIDPLATA